MVKVCHLFNINSHVIHLNSVKVYTCVTLKKTIVNYFNEKLTLIVGFTVFLRIFETNLNHKMFSEISSSDSPLIITKNLH